MSIRCSPKYLLVKPRPVEDEVELKGTDKKLVIARSLSDQRKLEAATTEGTVLYIGEEIEPWYKTGDTIAWGKYSGYWITDPETKEELLLLHPEDVLCVINQGEV
jgi:co-chaperonin GroES (HSP10)